MEVVTLAKLWGRVGDNPHLSPPARGGGGFRISGLSLYICTTWWETPAPVSPGAGAHPRQHLPGAPPWLLGSWGSCRPPAGCDSCQGTGCDAKAQDQPCTLLWTLQAKVDSIKKPGKVRGRGVVSGQEERLPPSVGGSSWQRSL